MLACPTFPADLSAVIGGAAFQATTNQPSAHPKPAMRGRGEKLEDSKSPNVCHTGRPFFG